MKAWNPISWQNHPTAQAVSYPDQNVLNNTLLQLERLPPLVTEREIEALKALLAKAGQGEAFILQGGDCCELFNDCQEVHIINKFKILLQMSVILIHSLKKPVIRIGRIAGQYAKPRSAKMETVNNITLPVYRGDMINRHDFTPEARRPDPQRMLLAYYHASATLNYLRALAVDGFADLHQPKNWQLGFMEHSAVRQSYQVILDSVLHSMQFFESILGVHNEALKNVQLFTSHEALHLPYESALTRKTSAQRFYNLSTHLPWVGMRTLSLEGGHIEYLRGIANPVGIKVGPQAKFDELLKILEVLNPENAAGKIVLIHRFGKEYINEKLPELLSRIKAEKLCCTVICDPMHGNTRTTNQGFKTRCFDDILQEIMHAFRIHSEHHLPLAGIHFEMTGDEVTECIGGSCGLIEADLNRHYTSLVDPRLNYQQALEMALQIAQLGSGP